MHQCWQFEGEIGSIWRIFPLVVISVLIWSLIESLTILPAHLAHSSEKKSKYIFVKTSEFWQKKIQVQIVGGLNHVIKNFYKPFRKSDKSSIFSPFLLQEGFCNNSGNSCQWLFKILFFPAVEDDLAIATIEYASGTPLDVTKEGFEKLEKAATL